MKKQKEKGLRKTLGLFSLGGIVASLFMGYVEITGNAVSLSYNSSLLSLGGVAFFVLGLIGLFLAVRE